MKKIDVKRQARAMKAYIMMNCTRNVKLADLSRDFGYSQRHTSRIFKDSGTTFQKCRRQARLRIAKRLLRQTRTPISKIVTQSGYKFTRHFFDVFKESVGVSPSQYRLQHTKKRR